ncbi:MAG: helix-turn-helix transcriptional regulator [Opitutaceae bacterium]|nr:helix-turn-helix transcriptional regulator [Opitutaceae bacterium]
MPQPVRTSLEAIAATLPQPSNPLLGRRPGPLVLPDNIICFQRRSTRELNHPRRGRALHHRFVLILALRGGVPVCVDDRVIPLDPGEGLLVFPFQFHHYLALEDDRALHWAFITFDLADAQGLAALQYQPFTITREVRDYARQLISAYQEEGRTSELPALLLALLLAHLRRQEHAPQRQPAPDANPGLVTQVNQLAHRVDAPITIKELARTLGISQSHLRARFQASCGVSLGRHLRRLRLERACGLLRLTPDRITEVAAKCGFTSIYTFSRAFSAAYGRSPMDYRRGTRPRPTRPKPADRRPA